MKEARLDPRRLDVARFARASGHLAGRLDASALPRLTADSPLADGQAATWQADGEWVPTAGGAGQTWVHLRADASVVLACQRCLQPLVVPLSVDRRIRFVGTEEEAERLDEEGEDDVLAQPPRGLDLPALVEDELILALPLVPRHGQCPQPLPQPDATDDANAAARSPADGPFAALAALKSRAKSDNDAG